MSSRLCFTITLTTALVLSSRAPAQLPSAPFAAAATTNSVVTATTAAGIPRFLNYVSPPGSGDNAGEPSIGINWTTEQVFSNSGGPIPNGGTSTYFGGFLQYMLKVTFDDCQSPANATWVQKPLLTANSTRVFGDPILYTDKATGRTLVSQLEGLTPAGSTTDYTDDDGDSFHPTEGSGLPSCVDHQTLGGGPFHAPLTGTLYPNAVYYASQCVSHATCSLSLDGGVTFGPGVPMFTVADCDGLHGHLKVAPDGTVYVPDKGCGGTVPLLNGGEAAVVVSEDNGLTWHIRTVPGATTTGDDDPSVGVATDGTIYLGYQSADGHPRIAVSHDKGMTWPNIRDVGASLGIQNCTFPAVVAGDGDRAAFAFYGTTTGGANYDQPEFTGDWYLYIATTFDGGATWLTQNVTPGDPVQHASGICGSGTCRNQLDFFDASIDKEGRVLVGWDDGCIGGCATGGANSFTAKAVITRQSGGMRMFAAFDPVEPRIPEAPGVGGTLSSGTVHLSWRAPDDGGAVISGYRIYRKVNSGAFTLIATVLVNSYTDTVNPTDQNLYRVTAVNSQGEGPFCHDLTPDSTLPPTACVVPGILSLDDVSSVDGSDLDSGQNTPPDPSVNVRHLFVAEPFVDCGVNQLTFTLQVAPSTGSLPASSQWYIIWNRRTVAADGSDRRFVAMKTDALGVKSFVYGDFGPPLPIGGVPPANANTPLPLGDADFGSYDPASGVITIKLANSKADATALVAGNDLAGLNVRTYFVRPDAGQKSQNNASDITVNGSYHLVGNASCFCIVDQAPLAVLTATPTSGDAPLTVMFNGSGSSDPDCQDGVASYTFNFGDGSPPVTQSGSMVSHTYNSASSPSGFFATLTVNDQKCDKQSLNVASVSIEVTRPTGVTPVKLPRALGIAPMSNPSHGQTFFRLDLDRDDQVNVQVFDAAGRRVANLLDASMPAGTHSLHWRGLDPSGKPIPAGLYLVRATAGGRVAVTRIVMLR